MQNALLISTCSLWSQWLGPVASEVKPGFGSPQGRKYSTSGCTGVLKEALVRSGIERRKVPSASIAPSWPQMVCYAPPAQPQADGCKFCGGLRAFPWLVATFQSTMCFISSPEGLSFQVEPKRKPGSGCKFQRRGGGQERPPGKFGAVVLENIQVNAKLGPKPGTPSFPTQNTLRHPCPGETEESGCCPSCYSNLLIPVLSLCLICCSPHPNPWFVIQSEEGKKKRVPSGLSLPPARCLDLISPCPHLCPERGVPLASGCWTPGAEEDSGRTRVGWKVSGGGDGAG